MNQDSQQTSFLADEEATLAFGARLGSALVPGDLILLEGPLGVGKTTVVRGLVAGLGGDPREVCSPTFVLLETYEVESASVRRVHHADLYRLRGRRAAAWEEVGLGEALSDRDAVTAVEWPDDLSPVDLDGVRVVRVRLACRGTGRQVTVLVD